MKFHGLWLIAISLGVTGSLRADNFAPPAEGPVAFRRDRVPLDVETMARLAEQLVALARSQDGDSAASRRRVAQMLALSLALDPAKVGARSLIASYEAGGRPQVDPGASEREQAGIWHLIKWLETPDAGPDGQALAACLRDVASASNPQHPQAGPSEGAPERGAWKGWIPPLSAYQAYLPDDIPEPAPPQKRAAVRGLAQARVITPLWSRQLSGAWILSPAALQMTVESPEPEDGGMSRFSLVIGATEERSTSLRQLVPAIQSALILQHGALPADLHIRLGGEALQASLLSRKRHSVSAAAAVLASAAISGRELAEATTIIGSIDETGAFTLPTQFWDQLRALERGHGGRLLLPAAAAEYLPSLLALEQPMFFFKYEVLLASNLGELLERSAKIVETPMAEASGKFSDLRAMLGNRAVGHYVANALVRRRLEEIAQELPFHRSAAMLAVQGAGERPIWVIRPVMIAEIQRALEPLEWLVARGRESFTAADQKRLGSTWETCRERLEGLVRYCAREDRELLSSAQNLMTTLRALERTARTRESLAATTYAAFIRDYKGLALILARAAGEPDPIIQSR